MNGKVMATGRLQKCVHSVIYWVVFKLWQLDVDGLTPLQQSYHLASHLVLV